MSKTKAFFNSLYKNVFIKRKFKVLFLIIFDKSFRNSINRLYNITKHCTKSEMKRIPFNHIIFGHRIVYKKYSAMLEEMEHTLDIPPIRVVENKDSPYPYVVVDGNHRFPAMITRAIRTDGTILCEVIS